MLTDPASFPYLYRPSWVRFVRNTCSGQYRHRYPESHANLPSQSPVPMPTFLSSICKDNLQWPVSISLTWVSCWPTQPVPYLYQPSWVRCARTSCSGQYRHRYPESHADRTSQFPVPMPNFLSSICEDNLQWPVWASLPWVSCWPTQPVSRTYTNLPEFHL
jgi:hypothetical protein